MKSYYAKASKDKQKQISLILASLLINSMICSAGIVETISANAQTILSKTVDAAQSFTSQAQSTSLTHTGITALAGCATGLTVGSVYMLGCFASIASSMMTNPNETFCKIPKPTIAFGTGLLAATAAAIGTAKYTISTLDPYVEQLYNHNHNYLNFIYVSSYILTLFGTSAAWFSKKDQIMNKIALTKLKIQNYLKTYLSTAKNSLKENEKALSSEQINIQSQDPLVNNQQDPRTEEEKKLFTQQIDIVLKLLDLYVQSHYIITMTNDDLQKLYDGLTQHLIAIENAPSIRHLQKTLNNIITAFDNELPCENIQKTIAAGLEKEQELIAQGYVPFVHGRQRHYDFLTQLYAFLMSLTTGKQNNINFIPTHIKQPITDLIVEKQKRKDLIANGNHNYDQQKRQRLLFLNHFIFGNTTNRGSCSFHYMLNNQNAGNITISIRDIFFMLDLEEFYDQFHAQYSSQLKDLQKKYKEISPQGQILQIGITPKKLKKSVYLTTSGGPKKSLNAIQSDKIDEIIKYLDEHPEDQTEFVLVNTFDKYGGLNEHDMKISVLDPADHDPETLKKKIACNKERDELFAAIEADYKAMIAQNTKLIAATQA